MAEPGSIYSAVYSGVPVFEMLINGVAIMRRRTDSYMNATQILKVANIDKGRRTKILEKEVLTGEHEKVQGGYGKYQGTWIPVEKSRELAARYGVYDQLAPLLQFDMSATSNENGEEAYLTKEQVAVARRKMAYENSISSTTTTAGSSLSKSTASTKSASSSVSAPPPSAQATSPSVGPPQTRELPSHTLDVALPARKRAKASNLKSSSTPALSPTTSSSPIAAASLTNPATSSSKPITSKGSHLSSLSTEEAINEAVANERNRSLLMSIFLNDKPEQIPDLLKSQNTKSTFNIDMVIDEQGNTALHWASALARTSTVGLLVSKGASVSCKNYPGETPLMRGVMVTNNFDGNSFPQLFDILKESITVVDNKKRSVLHHAALTAGIHGRTNAAIYYMKLLVDYIKETDTPELKALLDAQDCLGDTALNIAARLDCQSLVETLSNAGATQTAQNQVGLNSKDYSAVKDVHMEDVSPSQSSSTYPSKYAKNAYTPSQRGKEIIATVQKIVDALDEEYGAQLSAKEQELQSVQDEINAVTRELESTRKGLEIRQAQSQKLSEAQQKTRNIEAALDAGWKKLEETMLKAGKSMPCREDIENVDEHEDIDSLFNVPELHIPEDVSEEVRKKQLEDYVKNVQAKVKAYRTNDQALQREINKLRNDFIAREIECKRLIAACCNLPVEKIDELVEPLTLAIESDPPDLDLARVIGFMDKIRRQGAFVESSQSSSL